MTELEEQLAQSRTTITENPGVVDALSGLATMRAAQAREARRARVVPISLAAALVLIVGGGGAVAGP